HRRHCAAAKRASVLVNQEHIHAIERRRKVECLIALMLRVSRRRGIHCHRKPARFELNGSLNFATCDSLDIGPRLEARMRNLTATSRPDANPRRLGLWAQIREDWQANGRDWTRPGFRALAVHRFGVWRMGVKPRVLRIPLSFIYRTLYRFVRNHYGIE